VEKAQQFISACAGLKLLKRFIATGNKKKGKQNGSPLTPQKKIIQERVKDSEFLESGRERPERSTSLRRGEGRLSRLGGMGQEKRCLRQKGSGLA